MVKQIHKSLLGKISLLLTAILVGLAVLLFPVAGRHQAIAAPSSNLNFQARLQSSAGSVVPDGYYNIEFKLYNVSSGGSDLWTETWYDSNGATAGNDNRVRVVNGYLTVSLGSLSSFGSSINWDQEHWITMNIGGATQTASPTWDGEMNPRLQLTAIPYAFQAGTLAKTSGANRGTLSFGTVVNNPDIKLPDINGTNNVLLQSGTTLFSQGSIPFTDANGRLTQDNTNFYFDDSTDRLGVLDNTPAYALTVGNGDLFGVQSDGSVIWEGSSADANETILTVVNPTADLTFRLPDATAGTYDICTTADNCTALSGYIRNSTSLQTNANFNIQSDGDSSITAQIRARASQTADLLQFRNSGNTAALAGFDSTGSLYLRDSTSGFTSTISVQAGSLSGSNKSLTLPNAGGEICTSSGNCIGNGGSGDVFKNGQTGPLILGTNDNTSFYLETNNNNRIEIQGDGDAFIGNSVRVTASATSVLTGSIDPVATANVTGVGTLFTTELVVGDRITVSGESRTVTAIASNTSLTVNSPFSDNGNDTSVDRLPAAFVVRDSSNVSRLIMSDRGSISLAPDANVEAITVTGYSLTGSANNNLLDLSGTWNTSGSPSGIKLNITNTASGSGARLIELQEGGSRRFSVEPNGSTAIRSTATAGETTNLGLSTSAALEIIQASTTTNNYATLKFSDSDAAAAGISARFIDHTNDYADLLFATRAADGYNSRMYITSAGNVGIGTITPVARFQVQGAAAAAGTGTISSSGTTVTGSGASFTTQLSVGDVITASGQTRVVAAIGGNNNLTTVTAFSPVISAGTSFTYQSAIQKLVDGSGTTQFLLNGAGTAGLGTIGSAVTKLTIQGTTTDSTAAGLNVTDSAGTSRLYVRNDGNVGFGTTAPTFTLHAPSGTANIGSVVLGENTTNNVLSLSYNGGASEIANRSASGSLLLKGDNAGGANIVIYGRTNAGGTGIELNGDNATIDVAPRNLTITGSGAANTAVTNVSGADVVINGGIKTPSSGGTDGDVILANTRGMVGIGTTAPSALLSVGSTSQFQVNSSGAIAAATGIAHTGNFVQSGVGTFSTGTGTVSLNGATSITGSNTLTVGSGATTLGGLLGVTGLGTFNGGLSLATGFTFTNASSTLNTAIAISDKPTGGPLGTAAATVDVATSFTVNQTTANQTITIPNPTIATAGRIIYISNIGTQNFTLLGSVLNAGASATLVWNGTAWTFGGADGTSINNQTAIDQSASFRITGTGRANTSFVSPLFTTLDSQGSNNSPDVTFRSGNAASGNNNSSGSVTIKSGDATNGSNGSSGSITIDAGAKLGAGTAGSISLGATNASSIILGRSGITTTINGNLTVATGGTFANASSTLFSALVITDKPSGGNIGTAATTVDVATTFDVNQTTASQTLTLPSPTVTSAGRIAFVSNVGSVSFTMYGVIISPSTTSIFFWNGTAWTPAGIDGSGANYIQNQNSTNQTGNFRISGTGQANTSFLTPSLDVASAGTLSIGTSTATAITLGKSGITTTNSGALTVSQLLTGNLGATIAGAAISLNDSSNFNTSINTGTSTGTISIGNSVAGAITLQSGAAINLTAGAASTLSTGNNSLTVTSSNFNVSSAGVVTLAGAQTADITTTSAATANGITIQGGISTAATGTGAALTLKAGDQSGTTTATGGGLSLQAGSATGASGTRTGGNVSIDAGSGATANGTVNIGTTNAASLSIGRSGVTTTNNGALTVTQSLTANGGITVGANQNFTLQSGSGTFSQTYVSGSASSAHTINLTNNNTGAGVAIQGVDLTPTNTSAPSGGTNTLNVVNFGAGGALGGSNTTNGINFASATGYTNFIKTPTFVLSSAGAISGVTTYNGLALTSVADGFTVAGGTTSRTLTVTGADVTVGNTITPTSAGAIALQSNGANTVTVDAGGASTLNLGTTNATTINVGRANNAVALNLQGNASSVFSATNATGTTILGFAAPSTAGSVTFQLPAGGTGGNTYGVCTTLAVCTGYQASGNYESPLTFNNGLTRSTNTVQLGGALTGNTNLTTDNVNSLSFSSTLTAADRTASLFTLTQADDATNSMTGSASLLRVDQLDVTSSSSAIYIDNNSTAAGGYGLTVDNANTTTTGAGIRIIGVAGSNVRGLEITGITTGNAIQANSVTTGTVINATGITTGIGLNVTATTQGRGLVYNTTSNGLTTGSAVSVTGAASGITADYTGALINLTPTRTLTAAATRTDSGQMLNAVRTNAASSSGTGTYNVSGHLGLLQGSYSTTTAGSTMNITGDILNLSSNCTQTLGTCTDSSNILDVSQQYANASGAALNVTQAGGTGGTTTDAQTAVFDATNSEANGVSVDVQSSATTRYALSVTSNNGSTQGLYVRADGNVGIGNAAPSSLLAVGSSSQFQVSSAGAVTAVGVNSGTGLIQGTGGLTISGAAISLNDSSNFATSINGGTSTGTVTIGNNAAGAIAIESGSGINIGNNAIAQTVNIGNSTGATAFTISTGTGGLNIGDNANTKTTDIGGNDADGTDTVRIATNATSADAVTIGSIHASSTLILEAGTGASAIQIGNSANAHGIQIGTGAAVQTVAIGSSNGGSSLTLQAGTGNLSITTQGTGTLGIGNNGVAQTIAIGNTTGATALNLLVGSGNFSLDGVAASTYTLGASTVGGTIAIGGSGQTGTITLGSSSGTNSVLIGNGAGATTVSIANANIAGAVNIGGAFTTGTITVGGTAQTGALTIGQSTDTNTINIGNNTIATAKTGTVNIATGATGTGKTVVAIGSSNDASSVTINTGTGGLNIGDNANAKTTDIGGNDADGTDTVRIATNATSADGITIGSVNSGSILTLEAGTGANAIQIGNGATAHGIKIGTDATATQTIVAGSTSASSTTTIQGGTGASAVSIQAASGGTISVGSAAASTINVGTGAFAHTIAIGTDGTTTQGISIGSASASSTLALQGGTGGSAVSIQAASGGTISVGSAAASTINIGTGAFAHTIAIGTDGTTTQGLTLGSTSASSTTSINGGTGTSAVTINTGGSGVVNIGDNALNKTVDIGGVDNSGQDTVNIATNATSADTITIGSTHASSIATFNGGAYNLNIRNTGIGINATAPTTGSVDLFFGAGNRTMNINQSAASTAGGNLTINAGMSGSGAVNGGNLVLQAGATGGSGTTGSVIIRANGTNSATAFQIQQADNTALLTADTTTASPVIKIGTTGTPTFGATTRLFVTVAEVSTTIRIGDGTNGVSFNDTGTGAASKLRRYGTARETTSVTLVPEFAGAVMTGDGSNNTGTMTSDFCSGTSRKNINNTVCAATDEHNYYAWTSQATNDYDIYIRYQLPSDYDGIVSDNVTAFGWRNTSSETAEVTIFNAGGAQCGATTNVATGTAAWTSTAIGSISGDADCNTTNMAAGSTIIVRVRLTVGTNNNFARIGELTFDYYSKF